MLKKFKPSEAEVQVLNEDDQQLLSGTRSLGSGLTPELLNDLIQEKPDNVGTAHETLPRDRYFWLVPIFYQTIFHGRSRGRRKHSRSLRPIV